MVTLPRFLLEHKNSSDFFEICLPPEDSPWMKQAVVVSFEVFCTIYRYIDTLRNFGHQFIKIRNVKLLAKIKN